MKTERLTSYPQNFTWPNRIYKIKDDTKSSIEKGRNNIQIKLTKHCLKMKY